MSFFLQSERKTNLEKLGTPAPCQYVANSLSNSRQFGCAPFGSTQPLNRSNVKNKATNPQKEERYQQTFFNDLNARMKPQQQVSSMFKSGTQRFRDESKDEKPGPGQYDVLNKLIAHSRSNQKTQYNQIASIKPTVPSIPVDNLGFKQDENNQMKKVKAPKTEIPHVGSYELRTNLSARGILAWKTHQIINKQTENNPGPGQYDYALRPNKSLSSCFNSTSDRFGKAKKIKEEKAPGPGSYNVSSLKKYSHNMSSDGYFNSKTSRFERINNNQSVGPGMYFNDKNKSRSVANIKKIAHNKQDEMVNNIPNRLTIFEINNKNPGPGSYKNNFGISYQLHKALLRKQTTDVMPRQKRKVFEVKEEEANPGPGTYESSQKKRQQHKGKLWKKSEVINLKQEPENTPSPMDYTVMHNTIQAKVKKMNSKLTLTQEKPFNSGSQRFKHYNVEKRQQRRTQQQTEQTEPEESGVQILKGGEGKKIKRLVMTTIKVRVPFGISSNKYEQKQSNFDGPDFYDKPKQWIKPTFSIRGKVQ